MKPLNELKVGTKIVLLKTREIVTISEDELCDRESRWPVGIKYEVPHNGHQFDSIRADTPYDLFDDALSRCRNLLRRAVAGGEDWDDLVAEIQDELAGTATTKPRESFLDAAMNEGDGTYKP